MCKVDGIEVMREDMSAWDAAVASFQRRLRGHLHLTRMSTEAHTEHQNDDPTTCFTATGNQSRAVIGNAT